MKCIFPSPVLHRSKGKHFHNNNKVFNVYESHVSYHYVTPFSSIGVLRYVLFAHDDDDDDDNNRRYLGHDDDLDQT